MHRPASHTIVGGERNCLFHDTMETADGRRHERSRLLGVMGGRHDPEKVLPARPMPGVCVRTTPLPHATRWCCYVTPAAQALRLCRAAVGGIVQTKWVHGGASTRGANMLCMNLPLFFFVKSCVLDTTFGGAYRFHVCGGVGIYDVDLQQKNQTTQHNDKKRNMNQPVQFGLLYIPSCNWPSLR